MFVSTPYQNFTFPLSFTIYIMIQALSIELELSLQQV